MELNLLTLEIDRNKIKQRLLIPSTQSFSEYQHEITSAVSVETKCASYSKK
jgi:hypothetical protein